MNPHVRFWIPAALRVSAILVVALVLWFYVSPLAGLAAGLFLMCCLVVMQLFYLSQLDFWLETPSSDTSPGGWGAWAKVYGKLKEVIEDQEKSQRELSQWLAHFRQAMALLPIGVVIMDDVLFLEWCNRAAERHLGLHELKDKGMRITNLVRHPDFISYLVLGRYDEPLMVTIDERKLVLQVIPFEDRRQILVSYDRTEEEEVAQMRRDFVANASHELRTPLTVINGFLEVAEMQPEMEAETRVAHLQLMREQGERMQSLVDNMLVLTSLESNDNPLRRDPVEVHNLIRQIYDEACALSNGNHEISLLMENGPETVFGSADELRTAFGNLVTNAVRYTLPGGRIDIVWENTDSPESGPRFMVKDTGIGIGAEHIPRLTQRFYLVDKTRSRKERGTGLGLAIVRHVLLRHRAKLDIESEPGVGSVFVARFTNSVLVP